MSWGINGGPENEKMGPRIVTSVLCKTAEILLKATNEERGTVAGLATLSQTLDKEHPDGM